MTTLTRLAATALLATVLAAGVLLGLSSPASAGSTGSAGESTADDGPTYGETVPIRGADTFKVAGGILAGVIGAGLIAYSITPASRQQLVRVNDREHAARH